jgi:hypothetical protein
MYTINVEAFMSMSSNGTFVSNAVRLLLFDIVPRLNTRIIVQMTFRKLGNDGMTFIDVFSAIQQMTRIC